jgi:hypothetical protein
MAREQLRKVAVMGAQSAGYLDKWDDMAAYVSATNSNDLNGALYRVIVHIHGEIFFCFPHSEGFLEMFD